MPSVRNPPACSVATVPLYPSAAGHRIGHVLSSDRAAAHLAQQGPLSAPGFRVMVEVVRERGVGGVAYRHQHVQRGRRGTHQL